MIKILIFFLFFNFLCKNLIAGSKKSIERENETLTKEVNELKNEVDFLENKTLSDLKKEKLTLDNQIKIIRNKIVDYRSNINETKANISKKIEENQAFEKSVTGTFNKKLELDGVSLFSAKELNQKLINDLETIKRNLASVKITIGEILKSNNILDNSK